MSLPEAALRTLALLSTALLLGTPDRVLNGQTKTVASTQGGVGVKRMEIESSAWNGRKTIRQRMVIRATSTGHAAKDRRVDSDAIRELVALLNAPPLPLNLKALGINQDWLRQNGFNDEAGFLKTVNQYYSDSVILDDDAEFRLELVQEDGSRIWLRSSQSHAYRIPWRITTPTKEFETYNAAVSQAVIRLLPDGFVNRLRIGGMPHGRGFSYEIGATSTHFPR